MRHQPVIAHVHGFCWLSRGTPWGVGCANRNRANPVEISLRHITGDWGDLEDADKKENELSVKEGFRILSAYNLETGIKVWVITEADKTATTILLPDDY